MNLATLKPRKPGDPGIPGAGRPKGSKNAKTIVTKLLMMKEEMEHPLLHKRVKLTQLEIIALKQLEQARKGNIQAFNALIDRMEGKAEERHTFDGPVTFIYNEPDGNQPVVDENPDPGPETLPGPEGGL